MRKTKTEGSGPAWLAISIICLILGAECTADADTIEIPPVDEVYPELPPTPAERLLVEAVAKTSFNEALDSYQDLALIWQITEGHGDTALERLSWLRAHSRCVNGGLSDSEANRRPGNCRWSRNLTPDGRQPRGWIPSENGRWSVTRERWLAHLERVRDFVYQRDTFRPCGRTPVTWDGRRWLDQVLARGGHVIECGPTRNVGVEWRSSLR